MEVDHTKYVTIKVRTKHSKHFWATFASFLVVFIAKSGSEPIDFDDVETSWLKNVAVYVLPTNNMRNHSTQMLKITGLASADIEDGVHIKPTFSSKECIGNENELQITNKNESPNNSINTDIIILLSNFEFKHYSSAYLCIKTKYDHHFQHMGQKSKFSK